MYLIHNFFVPESCQPTQIVSHSFLNWPSIKAQPKAGIDKKAPLNPVKKLKASIIGVRLNKTIGHSQKLSLMVN